MSRSSSIPALTALVVGIVVLVAALVVASAHERPFRSIAQVAITPVSEDPSEAASVSDTLSRGTIVATFAQALASPLFTDRVLAEAGLTEIDIAAVDIDARVIAGTSIVEISAISGSPTQANRAAEAVSNGRPTLGGYTAAFVPQLITPARGATQIGAGRGELGVIGALAALAAAAFTYVGLVRLARRSAEAEPAPAAPTATDGEGEGFRESPPPRSEPVRPAPRTPSSELTGAPREGP